MDVKKVYEENNLHKYLIKGTTTAFMNSLRRTIMTCVPCLAIDEVTIYENDSVVFDEMLANRLGLLPIKTDVKTYKENDTVKLVLDKTGPGKVTSKDIKCTDPKIEILDKNIYITNLSEEQKVRLEMTAIMKKGKEHAKHQPAIVSYNELPSIKNNDKIDTKALLADMPKGSIEVKAGKLFLLDPYNINFQNQPENILEQHSAEIEYSNSDFVLSIETTGQLTTSEIISSALETMNAKLEELKKEVDKL